MRAGTTSWATSCSLRSRAGPPLRCARSSGRACPTVAYRTSALAQVNCFRGEGISDSQVPNMTLPTACSATASTIISRPKLSPEAVIRLPFLLCGSPYPAGGDIGNASLERILMLSYQGGRMQDEHRNSLGGLRAEEFHGI